MHKLFVANTVSVDGFYSGPNDDVMAMPFDRPFSDYDLERLRAADTSSSAADRRRPGPATGRA